MSESIVDTDKISRAWQCISVLWKNITCRWICITKGIYKIDLHSVAGYFNNGSPYTAKAENQAHSIWLGVSVVLTWHQKIPGEQIVFNLHQKAKNWVLQSAKDASPGQPCPGDSGAKHTHNSVCLSCCQRVLGAVVQRVFSQLFLPTNRLSQKHISQLIPDAIKLIIKTNQDILELYIFLGHPPRLSPIIFLFAYLSTIL